MLNVLPDPLERPDLVPQSLVTRHPLPVQVQAAQKSQPVVEADHDDVPVHEVLHPVHLPAAAPRHEPPAVYPDHDGQPSDRTEVGAGHVHHQSVLATLLRGPGPEVRQ